jgi:hypothetical protein
MYTIEVANLLQSMNGLSLKLEQEGLSEDASVLAATERVLRRYFWKRDPQMRTKISDESVV